MTKREYFPAKQTFSKGDIDEMVQKPLIAKTLRPLKVTRNKSPAFLYTSLAYGLCLIIAKKIKEKVSRKLETELGLAKLPKLPRRHP